MHRSIRLDAFEPDYHIGGVDRGPTPTVSVLDGAGKVVKTQRVYPNKTLNIGSLTIYPADYGLAANVSIVDTSGVETGRSVQLIDFSDEATGGTVPAGLLYVDDSAGNPQLEVAFTVPLDRTDGQYEHQLPKTQTARVVVASLDGTPLLDRTVSPGQDVALPVGGSLRLNSLGYYARLQVVDDWSILLLYAGLVVAGIGLAITVLTRQQIILVTVIEGPEGTKLAATVRLWRNASSSRDEIESQLARALGGTEKGSTT